jgi:Family of unknown function (DUF6325)
MSVGPVEVTVVKFPGNQFKGEIAPALAELIESGTISVIDLIFLWTDENGELTVKELEELEDEDRSAFEVVVADQTDLLSETDTKEIAELIGPNSSAAILVFEHAWATKLRDAIVNAEGELVFSERIPRDVVEEAVAAAQT